MRHAIMRWLAGAAAGVAVGVAVAVAVPTSNEPPDPMRGVPPGGSTTDTVLESLESEPVYIDANLRYLLPDEEREALSDHIAGYDLATYVMVVRTGHNDGFNSFLGPRALRVAAESGEDGIYLAVDQSRDVSAAFVHDGAPVDSESLFLDDGRLGPAIATAIDELHDPEDSGGYAATLEWIDTSFRAPTTGEIAGGALIGAVGGLSVYGLAMLAIGIVRTQKGLPFAVPRGPIAVSEGSSS